MVPTSSRAQDNFAVDFGRIVGSEAQCGLRYDQTRIQEVVSERVPADDLNFTYVFGAYSGMVADDIAKMTTSEKTVHCTAVERAARSLDILAK